MQSTRKLSVKSFSNFLYEKKLGILKSRRTRVVAFNDRNYKAFLYFLFNPVFNV